MPTFTYRAKDATGNTVIGIIDAATESAAAGKIREMGHLPMDIRATVSEPSGEAPREVGSALARYLIYPLWTGVNIRALALFFRQLATLIASGMALSEALHSAGSRTGGRLGRIIAEACDNVRGGGRLSDTMSRYPRVFSKLLISLMRAGEAGGLLQSMTERIASYLEYELAIRRRIAMIMFYPIIIFFFIIVMPHVPTLVLDGPRQFGASLFASISIWFPWAIAALIVLKLLLQFEAVRWVWDFVKVLPPIIGTTARKIAMSRFSRALAVLYSAGMPISEAVSVAADACANVAIGRGIRSCVPAVQAGHGLTESLARTRAVTPMVLDMLSTGEKTGSMDTVLQKVADYMDDEADATIHKLGIALFVFMILIAAIIIGIRVIGFYGSYFGGVMEQAK